MKSQAIPRWLPLFALLAVGAMSTPASSRAGQDESPPASRNGHESPVDSRRPSAGEGVAPVDVVCKSAVAMALADPERARGFVSRARMAGWLPDVSFRVYRRFARTEGLSFDDAGAGVVAPVDISSIDDVRYEWRASWDLSRMVFNPDELQAHYEALRMSDVRRDIQSLVIRLYFERRRLVLEGQASSAAADDGVGTERRILRIGEIEAQLDALSDGVFSQGASARREAAPAP